jgi:hypothetical protein
VRAGVPDAAAAVLLSLVIYLVMMARVRAGTDPAQVTMGASMGPAGIRAYTISQAFGFAALVWSWGTIMLGLALSTRVWPGRSEAHRLVARLHRSTSLTVIALMLAHAVLLLADHMSSATPLQLFVPFASGYAAQRLPLALGILALYGALVFGPTFYLRDRLGPRTWRMIHAGFIPLVYVLGVWHTFARGEDLTPANPLWLALWALQVPVIAAFTIRCLAPARRSGQLARWTRPFAQRRRDAGMTARWPGRARGTPAPQVVPVLSGAVIAAIVVAGLLAASMPGQAMPGMGAGNPLLPGPVRITGALAYVVILLVHCWHVRACQPEKRFWHAGHILMALGMIDMFAPGGGMLVPATAGALIFAAAAALIVTYLVAAAARGTATGGLWPLAGLDLAGMVYMFTIPIPGLSWLTGLLVGWFVLQGIGWALKLLPGRAEPGEPTTARQPTPAAVAVAGASGSAPVATLPAPTVATRAATGGDLSVRISLAAMSLGMAYMFVAMQLGMPPLGAHPGMAGMPGM